MGDEHSDEISGRAPLVDPALFERADVRRILAALDVGGLYRVLGDAAGISQRQIAVCTGQSQSEISEIAAGHRRVESHQVLVRIAESFGIPRELMGLSWWGPECTYCGEITVAESPTGEDEDVRRRALIAATSMAALGQVVQGLGELTELALPTGRPLPSRLTMAHVHGVAAVTERLRGDVRQFGGQAGLFVAAARYYARWLTVSAPDEVKAGLAGALAELYTEAGWSCYDSGVDATGCLTRALRVADQFGDGFGIANAAWHAGLTMVAAGTLTTRSSASSSVASNWRGFSGKSKPASLRADDPRVPTLSASMKRDSATAYARLGAPEQAKRCLAEAREVEAPRSAFERGEMELGTGEILIDLRRFDAAEQFAASAVRAYGKDHCGGRTHAELMLAEVYVRAGEARGLVLARAAIDAASTLQSVAVRQERLVPLAAALEARLGNDAKEIAQTARQVATTRVG